MPMRVTRCLPGPSLVASCSLAQRRLSPGPPYAVLEVVIVTVAHLTAQQISGRLAQLLLNYQSVKTHRQVVFNSFNMPPVGLMNWQHQLISVANFTATNPQ